MHLVRVVATDSFYMSSFGFMFFFLLTIVLRVSSGINFGMSR